MVKLSTLKGSRDFQFGEIPVNQETCVGMEVYPANSYLAAMPFRAWIHGAENASANSVFDMHIKSWFLPAYGAEAGIERQYHPTTNDSKHIMGLYHMLVDKVDATAPDTAYTRAATDEELAEADSNPHWRRDRIALRVFEDLQTPAQSFHTEVVTLGWPDGSAYRTGEAQHVKVVKKLTGTIPTGIKMPIDGYVVHVAYIPPQLDQDDFGGTSGFAFVNSANRDFGDLGALLAPVQNPVLGIKSGLPTIDEYRRWAVKVVADKAKDHASRMDKPTKVNLRYTYDAIFPRMERTNTGLVSPSSP